MVCSYTGSAFIELDISIGKNEDTVWILEMRIQKGMVKLPGSAKCLYWGVYERARASERERVKAQWDQSRPLQ